MQIETKFSVGQTVYLAETGAKLMIKQIDSTVTEHGCESLYSGVATQDSAVHFYKEEELTSDRPKPKSVFELKEWDECFYIDLNGDIHMMRFVRKPEDSPLFSQGNVFLTVEDAKKELERRKAHQEMKKLANGCEFCVGAPNYYIVYEYGRNNFFVQNSGHIRMPGIVYFASEDEAWSAIRTIRMDRLMTYFGVGEK